ncbi:Uncharacterized protein CLAVI_000618 [Candidatus Clavichlamydia salmonicola]|uniref:tetratricopeptide repeat protein n=1 Tax=Candidatus Clavichlamydia salmonicola TaxID=469812 RepID=UPI001890DF82|nr:hypothetical protein [Candidatus Clavichlamydia salmonicola]MBF5050994.1 Uncharacterized protein [Candidatus Clavichlamydia salmonicola]
MNAFQKVASKESMMDKKHYQAKIMSLWSPVLKQISKLLCGYTLVNLLFITLFMSEIITFISAFFVFKNNVLALLMAATFFMSIFSFLLMRVYWQSTKSARLRSIFEGYLERCRHIIKYKEDVPEHYMALANAAHRFAIVLNEKEYGYYAPPTFLKVFSSMIKKISGLLHWKDIYIGREFLFSIVIEEHLKVVQCEPTDLGAHAALANAYVMLSGLYAYPEKELEGEGATWVPKERYSEEMKERFRFTAERAIEEFKILNDYAPGNPWVHVQLAYSYHDLQMPLEEIREYEIVLQLRPGDEDTLFKLGVLYFRQGMNAQGLRIYERLKRTHSQKAKKLINFYGSYMHEF